MDRKPFYDNMHGDGSLDYEKYLNTQRLLACQEDFGSFINEDELMFQIVHQSEELWMKLIGYSLLGIIDHMEQRNTNRVITLFRRVHIIQNLMIDHLPVLETMSPAEYQPIRLKLGNGSGQESPGFNSLLSLINPLWETYKTHYLEHFGKTIEQVYHSDYQHDDCYMVAEALADYDELFQKFRYNHIQLIHRTIGLGARSLKGRSVELLNRGMSQKLFPELWEIRNQMTDAWGGTYGVVRESIN
jgi:tryptophan 2,3-dioxygenase